MTTFQAQGGPMATWTISAATERVTLDEQRRAEATFTVTNQGPVDQRLVLDVVTEPPEIRPWFTVDEPQVLVAHGGSRTVLVRLTVPAGAAAGTRWFAGRAYSADRAPEETAVVSDRVMIDVEASQPPRKRNIWMWLVPAAVLALLVTGVVLFLLLRDDGAQVHASNELIVTRGPFDLDEIRPASVAEGADLRLDVDDFVTTTGNAPTLMRIHPTDDPRPACEAALRNGVFGLFFLDIGEGDFLCIRTGEGRLSVAEVTRKFADPTERGSSLTLQVTTFE